MNAEQRDYLLNLIKHDLSQYHLLDLGITKEKIKELLKELEYFKGGIKWKN